MSFQYIQCYGSITHPSSHPASMITFQYIQCYGSISHLKILRRMWWISIHPMLRFYFAFTISSDIDSCYFNTSNVTVLFSYIVHFRRTYHYFNTSNVTVLSEFGITRMTDVLYFNTSNVTVLLAINSIISLRHRYFNTSNVTVLCTSNASNKVTASTFQYIQCYGSICISPFILIFLF